MIYAELFGLAVLGLVGWLGYAWWMHLELTMVKLVQEPLSQWQSFTTQLSAASLANVSRLLTEWPVFAVGSATAILEGLTQRGRFPWSGYGRRLWRLSQVLLSLALIGLGLCVFWPSPMQGAMVYGAVVSFSVITWALTFSFPRTG